MTIFYPDISSHNAGISVAGAPAVCCKATEGTYYVNPDYGRAKADAAAHGVFFFAYHWLTQGNGAAQADYCHAVAGDTPLMLDVEFQGQTGSTPGVADVLAFAGRYRQLGGIVHLAYLPHWYWQDNIGSPDLRPLAAAGISLVSSDYTSYSDSGPGWNAYGGVTPVIWQYTDAQPFNGQDVDFNAFKGTLAELEGIVAGLPPAAVTQIVNDTDEIKNLASRVHDTILQYLSGQSGWPQTIVLDSDEIARLASQVHDTVLQHK